MKYMLKSIDHIKFDYLDADLFIDVGGNIGAWTIEMLDLHKKIIFIEPSHGAIEEAKARIKKHCDSLNCPEKTEKVEYHKILCSNVKGQKHSIVSHSGNTANFSIYAEDLYGKEGVAIREDYIETTNLDSFIEQIKEESKVLIKIDTEGCDLDVILGASELIKKCKPALLVEMHWHMYYNQEKKDAVFQLLNNLGYKYHIYKMEHYEKSPNQIFDHKHNGAQMSNLHFHMVMHHPSYGAKMESYSEEPINPPQIN